MIDKFKNIEGLFKNSLENFEADVDPGVWEKVSSQIGGQASAPDASSASSASGSSAVVGSVAVKSIIVLGTAGLLTLGAFYFINSDSDETTVDPKEISTEVVQEEDQNKKSVINEEKTNLQELSTENDANYISATTEDPIAIEIRDNKSQVSDYQAKESSGSKPSVQSSEPTEVTVTSAIVTETKAEEKEVVSEVVIAPVKIAQLLASIYASEKSGKKPLMVRSENKGTQAANIRWKIAGEPMYDQEQVINHTFEKGGKFWVVVEIRDETDQKSRDSVEILVEGIGFINVPNVFTPNGDGIHDAFVVETEDMKSLRCRILDRSGKVVFQWNKLHGHWDGRDMSGREVQPDTYFYIIEGVDNDGVLYLKKGTVSLYRN